MSGIVFDQARSGPDPRWGTIGELVREAAERYGGQEFLRFPGEERWGAPWRELYGSTESGLDLAVPPGAEQSVGTGAMGAPPPGKQVRVAGEDDGTLPDGEVGQILIRGRPMMTGYWNHPDSTERAFRGGWYHTGDLGFRDSAGWIHHAGRLKDMVRRGGENISAGGRSRPAWT